MTVVCSPMTSLEQEQERLVQTTHSVRQRFEQLASTLRLIQNPAELAKLDPEECGIDFDDNENRDPAAISANLATQTQFLRKLKYQYLEQNTKDRYVKSIVSDIDDAPIVSAENVQELHAINEDKKAKLKAAKTALATSYHDIRTLVPLVQEDYDQTKVAVDKASECMQRIIDARLALSRLRQAHPHPRLTTDAALEKLSDQDVEMQDLSDQIEAVRDSVQRSKKELERANLELETLRAERAEAEKLAKSADMGKDDPRIPSLYDWFIASLAFHRTVQGLSSSSCPSQNELHLTYRLLPTAKEEEENLLTIKLVFLPDTRQLATVDLVGPAVEGGGGDDFRELVDGYLQSDDVHGLVSAVLARARRREGRF